MTSVTCPSGHPSVSTDYCDVCGLPIGAAATPAASSVPAPSVAAPAVTAQACPNCSEPAASDALFCENCGYDFTTGTMPRAASSLDLGTPPPVPPAPQAVADWVVERWVDPDWYEVQQSDDPCPSPGLPVVIPVIAKSVLVGRPSKSRGITPEIDCGDDTGVSRRQAQLTTDGQRWWVEDLQSSNGTFVGPSSGPLPEDPISSGQRRELNTDDRVYVGAWTRLVVRKSTPEEQAGQA
ncbi:FHA domain-containing protein [Streptomyces sp. SID13031]|uniref:FHA domain-containing protein n=1 Tax=Streptomyces sp. SID13031 TaxID=2706046 RepID=UPI0013C66842|nr:FHA domain-containing protein [Streptomyces sp. SID13031]NEA34187.1 FHA domain-containing protein [Streptomyces sp. SID13031]